MNTAESQLVPPQGSKEVAHPGVKKPQPATESAAQPDPNLSQKLWNDAYDALVEDHDTVKVVESYLETLEVVLKEEKAKRVTEPSTSGGTTILAELKDRAKRQEYMAKLVNDGKARVAKASRITNAIGDVADNIYLAKPIVDIVMSIPQAAPAALPWAGFCIGLQVSNYSFIAYFLWLFISLRCSQIRQKRQNQILRALITWLAKWTGIQP